MAQKKPPHGRLLSYRADHAAGYFCPGVPGRLGSEIIPPAVDDYGAANDLRCAEAVGQHGHKRMAAAGKQGRQVAGVVRMRTAVQTVNARLITPLSDYAQGGKRCRIRISD